MQRIYRYLGPLVLGAALVGPMAVAATPRPQDRQEEKREEKREEKHERKERRYYDRDRKDYHVWNNRENEAYERWEREERREPSVRPFSKLNRREQAEYWNWRHQHPDNDHDRH